MRSVALLALAALALVLAGAGAGGSVQGDLLLTADRVFDGHVMIAKGAVLVRGGTIVAVGPESKLDIRARRTVRLGDSTILPGFVDLHTHQLGQGQLGTPVTTVRDVGAPIFSLPVPSRRAGYPRLLAAGPVVTVPAGYPIPFGGASIAGVVRSPAEGRALVRKLARRGAAVIKIGLDYGPGDWPVLSSAEIRAIVAEAHLQHLRVTAHVRSTKAARLGMEAGVDELAHMPFLPCGRPDPALMKELARRKIAIVGTLHVISTATNCHRPAGNARTFVRAGGLLLYGSDYGNPGIPRGIDSDELRMLVQVGLTPKQVVRRATADAGAYLGLKGVGRLMAGGSADVFAVHGNPFFDLRRLADPTFVVVGGWVALEPGRINLPPP